MSCLRYAFSLCETSTVRKNDPIIRKERRRHVSIALPIKKNFTQSLLNREESPIIIIEIMPLAVAGSVVKEATLVVLNIEWGTAIEDSRPNDPTSLLSTEFQGSCDPAIQYEYPRVQLR